jgi:hypothetical protein
VTSGERHIWPVLTADPAQGGTITAEAATLSEIDANFGAKEATPFKFDLVQIISNELGEDNAIESTCGTPSRAPLAASWPSASAPISRRAPARRSPMASSPTRAAVAPAVARGWSRPPPWRGC